MIRAAAAVAATVGLLLGLAACGESEPSRRTAAPPATARFRPVEARPPSLPRGHGPLAAYLTAARTLRSAPGGPTLTRLGRETEFGSPRIVPVVRRRGRWLGVLVPELPNGRVGWLDGATHAQLFREPYALEADVSRRELVVRRGERVTQRITVAVGRPGSPTPPGRYAVTDKLLMRDPGGPYGCCVLALTGHQPLIPQGWGGGDRLAIHSTSDPSSIGSAASLGCLRVDQVTMRRLVHLIPLGTRITIRA